MYIGASESHFEVETLATVSRWPDLSKNNGNIVRFVFVVIPDDITHARTSVEELEPKPIRKILKSDFDEN